MGECRVLLFLATGQVLQNIWHFEILTLESMGRPKMWYILKTADRRAKRRKMWDSGYYSTHIEVSFNARLLDFGLGSFGALYKISNFTIGEEQSFKSLLLSQFSSVSSKLYTRYPNHGSIQAITFLSVCQKLKNMAF